MDVEELRLCLLCHSIPSLDERLLCRALLQFGSPAALLRAEPAQWRALGAPAALVAAVREARRYGRCSAATVDIERQLETLLELDARVLPVSSPAYPALLRTIHDPPPLLYLRGDAALLSEAQLGIVGSRRPSPAGRRAAVDLSARSVAAGLHVCSGLARGVDAAAHRGALDAGGRSVAVMATGIDILYPAGNRALAGEMARVGCLVTEFPPGSRPLRNHFPRRNRVISGLSLGVLVVEAALPSGSLITAAAAMEQGREVFALPWSMYHPGGRGCLQLLRDGATLVQDMGDILAELGPLYALQRDLFPTAGEFPDGDEGGTLPAGRRRILDLVGYEAVTVDQLACLSGLPVAQVMAELSALELAGSVARCPGGYIHA